MGPSITILDLRGSTPLEIQRGVKRTTAGWLALERSIRNDGTVARERLCGGPFEGRARAERVAGSHIEFPNERN